MNECQTLQVALIGTGSMLNKTTGDLQIFSCSVILTRVHEAGVAVTPSSAVYVGTKLDEVAHNVQVTEHAGRHQRRRPRPFLQRFVYL